MPLISNSMPYLDNLATALAGGTVGSLVARLKTQRREGESEEDYRTRIRNNVSTGLFGGAAIGASLPEFYGIAKWVMPEEKSGIGHALGQGVGKTVDLAMTAPGIGTAVGATGGAIWSRKSHSSKLDALREAISANKTRTDGLVEANAKTPKDRLLRKQLASSKWESRALGKSEKLLAAKNPTISGAVKGGVPGLIGGLLLNKAFGL